MESACAFASGDVARACASGFEFSNTAETCHDFVTREISREASRAHPSRSADSTPRSPNDLLRWMLNPVERQRRGWESVGRRRARSRGASREKCVHPRLTQTGGEIRVRATTRPARDGAPCRARSSLESGCDRSKARRRRRAPGVRPGGVPRRRVVRVRVVAFVRVVRLRNGRRGERQNVLG